MTDAEFWGVMAEILDGERMMPGRGYLVCRGLCDVVILALIDELVSDEQMRRLNDQIWKWMDINRPGEWWAYPKGEWRPRIAMCRDLMKMAAKEGT